MVSPINESVYEQENSNIQSNSNSIPSISHAEIEHEISLVNDRNEQIIRNFQDFQNRIFNRYFQSLNQNFQNLNSSNQNIQNSINLSNTNYLRGFSSFLLRGVTLPELQRMRLTFHLSTFARASRRGIRLSWESEDMLNREEEWMRQEGYGDLVGVMNGRNMDNQIDNGREEGFELRAENNRRNIIDNSHNIFVNLLLNRRGNFGRPFIYWNRNNNINLIRGPNRSENNSAFIQGFIIGFILCFFSLFLIFCFRTGPKFRFGLILGIFFSFIIFGFPLLS